MVVYHGALALFVPAFLIITLKEEVYVNLRVIVHQSTIRHHAGPTAVCSVEIKYRATISPESVRFDEVS